MANNCSQQWQVLCKQFVKISTLGTEQCTVETHLAEVPKLLGGIFLWSISEHWSISHCYCHDKQAL